MTKQFLSVLKDVLVAQFGVRVILTTHSPSTVALAPEESIFVMSREEPRIQKAPSKSEAIGLLTAGLVIVSEGTRFVFVEDVEDEKFYSAVRDVLSDQGPSRDPMALKSAPSVVFIPASLTKTGGGGKTAVIQLVSTLNQPPLEAIMRGIIDLDMGNTGSTRVKVLSRYSIENYQYDPLNIFALLIEEGVAPALADVNVTKGDEHLLRTVGATGLQNIVNYIAHRVESILVGLQPTETQKMDVILTSGLVIQYPGWMITRRGKDLIVPYQKAFGQTLVTPPRLDKAFHRIRLIPRDLAAMMHELQSGQ